MPLVTMALWFLIGAALPDDSVTVAPNSPGLPRGGTDCDLGDCFCIPDEDTLEFCGGQSSQRCSDILTAAACNGATPIDRELVTYQCTTDKINTKCVNKVTLCWKQHRCEWIQQPGGGGLGTSVGVIQQENTTSRHNGICGT
jgi:hypothetical protein